MYCKRTRLPEASRHSMYISGMGDTAWSQLDLEETRTTLTVMMSLRVLGCRVSKVRREQRLRETCINTQVINLLPKPRRTVRETLSGVEMEVRLSL